MCYGPFDQAIAGFWRCLRAVAHQASSATASISTAALRGSEQPTAERACRPDSPKYADKEVGGAVDDGWLQVELARAVDKAGELDDALHLVEIAATGVAELRQNVDGAKLRRFGRFLDGKVLADLADHLKPAIAQSAVAPK